MVVTRFPCTVDSGVIQERVARPFTWTVHAAHSPRPHPNFVPVRLRLSRRTQRSGVCGSASTLCGLPFTFRAIGDTCTSRSSFPTDVSHQDLSHISLCKSETNCLLWRILVVSRIRTPTCSSISYSPSRDRTVEKPEARGGLSGRSLCKRL